MKPGYITFPVVLWLLVGLCGVVLVAMSFTLFTIDIAQAKTMRAIGLSFLFLGVGEYLNHPVQKRLTYNDRDDSGPQTTLHRSRNPCGLGNTLDVLALICLFVAFGLFLFPQQP